VHPRLVLFASEADAAGRHDEAALFRSAIEALLS
jgi:hypothetical protein